MRATLTRCLGIAASLVLLSSGCSDLYEADPVLAARADSSAAGYDVAMPLDDPPNAPPARGARPGPARPVAPAAATQPRTAPKPDTARVVVSAARDSTPRSGSGSAHAATTHPQGPADSIVHPTTQSGTDVATLPPELSAPADDSVVVNTFLSFNPSARTVWVDLIAGFDGGNGALNFNGGFEGAHTLAVPVGWRVEMRFLNRHRELSHSAIVVTAIDPVPMIAPPAAFPNAFTISLEEGIIEGRGDVVRFSADTEGRYLILCAVPGHGQSGMWVRLDVTPLATMPEYRRR